MNNVQVLDSLLALCKMEIQNQVAMCDDGLLITLGDGTKAVIKTKKVA